MSNEEICDTLVATFSGEGFTYDGLTGEGMAWSTTGEVNKSPKGMKIENGEYVGMD